MIDCFGPISAPITLQATAATKPEPGACLEQEQEIHPAHGNKAIQILTTFLAPIPLISRQIADRQNFADFVAKIAAIECKHTARFVHDSARGSSMYSWQKTIRAFWHHRPSLESHSKPVSPLLRSLARIDYDGSQRGFNATATITKVQTRGHKPWLAPPSPLYQCSPKLWHRPERQQQFQADRCPDLIQSAGPNLASPHSGF